MKSIKEIITESDSLCPYSNFSHPDCFKIKLDEKGEYTVCPKPFNEYICEKQKHEVYFGLDEKEKIYLIIRNASENTYEEAQELKIKPFYCPRCGKNVYDQLKK